MMLIHSTHQLFPKKSANSLIEFPWQREKISFGYPVVIPLPERPVLRQVHLSVGANSPIHSFRGQWFVFGVDRRQLGIEAVMSCARALSFVTVSNEPQENKYRPAPQKTPAISHVKPRNDLTS
jgi:hypothetical protein